MNNQRPGMLMPALVGGAVAGVLSGIPFVNCLCCLWAIGGGMLAAHMLTKDSPIALTTGDGAIVGIFSGIVATIVDFFVSIPLAPIANEFIRTEMVDFKIQPLTEQEVTKYYKENAFIWRFYLAARKIDRFITEQILRSKYEFRLPEYVKR